MNLVTEVYQPIIESSIYRKTTEQQHIRQMNDIGVDLYRNNRKFAKKRRYRTMEEQIERVCVKYDLKYLPLAEYAKLIPEENIAEIKRYQQTRETYQLMIIAPASHFGRSPIALQRLDPIVLDNKHPDFPLVTTWGNDFTFLRRVRGLWVNNHAVRLLRRACYPFLPFLLPISATAAMVTSGVVAAILAFWFYDCAFRDGVSYDASMSYCTKDYPLFWWL